MNFPEEFRVATININEINLNCFIVPFEGRDLQVMATIEPEEWERVTVSLNNRTPNWKEMCFVKNLFWGQNESCIQLHPGKKDYINIHEFCLHIFKPPSDLQTQIERIFST